LVAFSDDGVVDELPLDPEPLEPEPGVLGEVEGWLPLPDEPLPIEPLPLPIEPLPVDPLPVEPLPDVPPPVCASAKAGARPRVTTRPVITSFFIAPSCKS
jgi:hypothetical protein